VAQLVASISRVRSQHRPNLASGQEPVGLQAGKPGQTGSLSDNKTIHQLPITITDTSRTRFRQARSGHGHYGFSAVFLRKKAEELTPQLDGRRPPSSVTPLLTKTWRRFSLKKGRTNRPCQRPGSTLEIRRKSRPFFGIFLKCQSVSRVCIAHVAFWPGIPPRPPFLRCQKTEFGHRLSWL